MKVFATTLLATAAIAQTLTNPTNEAECAKTRIAIYTYKQQSNTLSNQIVYNDL